MLRRWFENHSSTSPGIWLVLSKKNSKTPTVTYKEAVEEALCFGWIDSTLHVVDDDHFLLLFSPRKENSIWSKRNKQRVEKLIKQGLMTPAGLQKIEAAKRNGSWHALNAVENLKMPIDLARALDNNSTAKRNFAALNKSTKKMLLYWIDRAKKVETRKKRIEHIIVRTSESKNPILPQKQR